MKFIKPKSASKQESENCGFCSQRHPNLDAFIAEVFTESTLHGVKYIALSKFTIVERVFWGIAVVACFGFSVHLVWDVVSKYNASPFIISFQPKETPVSDIPFPAITICNTNLLKASVLAKFFQEFADETDRHGNFTPSNIPPKIALDAITLDQLAQFCLSAPSFRRRIGDKLVDANGEPDIIDYLQNGLNALNDSIQEAADQLIKNELEEHMHKIFLQATMSCKDLIVGCIWAGEPFPCEEHFHPIETRSGRCCVFNMMPRYILQNISINETRAKREMDGLKDDAIKGWVKFAKKEVIVDGNSSAQNSDYPKFQRVGGKPYGLSILLNPDLNEYSTCKVNDGSGFKLVAHSPVSLPSIMDYSVAVPSNNEVFIDIEPEIITADQDTLEGIDTNKRGCYLPTDPASKLTHYNLYSAENCVTECIARHTQKNCSCVSHFMPRNSTQKLCGAKKRHCVEQVRGNITSSVGPKSFCSKCLPSCTEIMYKLEMSQFDLRNDNAYAYYPYNSSDGTLKNASNYSIVHLYYGTDSIYAKERKTLYSTTDLIGTANAGGLLSLTLGMSIISLVELVYFFTLRAWFEFQSSLSTKKGTGNDEKKDQNKSDKPSIGYYNWNIRKIGNRSSRKQPEKCDTRPAVIGM